MVWIAIAVLLTTIVINLHYRQPSTHTMPSWVRKVFIQKLPRILLMRVPIQVIKDSMGTRRSKFLRQSDPALKSLTGNEKKQTFCYLLMNLLGRCNVLPTVEAVLLSPLIKASLDLQGRKMKNWQKLKRQL